MAFVLLHNMGEEGELFLESTLITLHSSIYNAGPAQPNHCYKVPLNTVNTQHMKISIR